MAPRHEYPVQHPLSDALGRGTGVALPVFALRSQQGLGVGEFSDIRLLGSALLGCGDTGGTPVPRLLGSARLICCKKKGPLPLTRPSYSELPVQLLKFKDGGRR